MTILKWLLIIVLVGYIGAVAVMFFQQRAILFPIPTMVRTAPDAAGLTEAEEHVLETADGEHVIIWHVPAKPGHQVVLYFPGNGDFLAGSVGRFRNIISDGTGLIALSYRGYAGSSGQPSEQGLLQDAAATYLFAVSDYEAGRMVAWGFSLGSGVAVALAADHALGGLILEAPYTSIADIAAAAFPRSPQGSVSLRSAYCTRHGARPGHARHPGCDDPDPLRRAPVRIGP
jgi:pimeloyl-ACP methyl ester carboxylesterase